MPDRYKFLTEETIIFLMKFMPPALIALSISTALKMKKEKITILSVISSYIIGVGMAWLFSSFIYDIEDARWHTPAVAILAISGEKIAEYLIFKWDVGSFVGQLMNAIQDILIKLIKGK